MRRGGLSAALGILAHSCDRSETRDGTGADHPAGRRGRRRRGTGADGAGQERREKLAAETDDMLDEIDDVLESNAEDFVRSYVQKGGQ